MPDVKLEDLELYANNPTRVISAVISGIEKAWGTKTVNINSKSHPFPYCLDLIIAEGANSLNRNLDAVSKIYKVHATDLDDLSRSMSTYDWYGMYGNPSNTTLQFAISTADIKNLAVDYSGTSGSVTIRYKKLLIPKDTEIDVYGIRFCIENGIEIRLMEDESYQAVYDSTVTSPFLPISTNVLETDMVISNNIQFLKINVPVRQLHCDVKRNIACTKAAGLRDTYAYPDYLYAIRAFIVNDLTGIKRELEIVYNGHVFDSNTPTMTIGMDTTNNNFTYEIPEAYINNNMCVGQVTLYVYTTKGALEKDIGTIDQKNYQSVYQDFRYEKDVLNGYEAPLRKALNNAWNSLTSVSGGANPRDFSEIRQSVIYGGNTTNVPITDNQLTQRLLDYGYDIVKSVDFVTYRLYNVTKELPEQNNKGLYSSMGCYVPSLLSTINDLVRSETVYDNGLRVTMPSNTIFDITGDSAKLINKSDTDSLNQLSNSDKVKLINNKSIIYTPFYYVIDTTDNRASIRCYHLDNPIIKYQLFKYEKTSLGMELGVSQISMTVNPKGYNLTLSVKSGTSYKNLNDSSVGAQLSFTPKSSTTSASIVGVLLGIDEDGERVWSFDINSNYDVDSNDNLYLNNFSQFGSVRAALPIGLTQEISLIFTTEGNPYLEISPSDTKIDQSLFKQNMIAIIETSYKVTFGSLLSHLYTRIRPLVTDAQYQHYTSNVPATYQTTTYVRDSNGELLLDPEHGLPTVLNNAGAPQLDSVGNPIYLYLTGDLVYVNGAAVLLSPRELQYHFDFIGFDGVYYFATDEYDIQYANTTKNYFTDIIMQDMTSFSAKSLERTDLQFEPISKLGNNSVVINSRVNTTIRSDLTFSIVYYLTADKFKDDNIKNAILAKTPQVINVLVKKSTISTDDVTSALKAMCGNNVEGIKLIQFTDIPDVSIISSLDETIGFSVRKYLGNNSDGVLTVTEAIEVLFEIHH